MLFARIDDVDFLIIDGNINWELDAVSEFTVKLIANQINYTDILYKEISIIYAGQTLISGIVDKRPVVQVGESKLITVDLSCVNEIGYLANRRALRNQHFQNVAFSTALSTLIASTPDWILDTSTLTSGAETITIDLRSKETLLSQLVEVILSVPGVHFRYGGMSGSDHILEVGEFNDLTTYAYRGFNLKNITLQPQENKYYGVIEAYSGRTDTGSAPRLIRLNLASVDARYLASPHLAQFPISQDMSDNAWIITNNDAPANAASIRKSFSYIKTKNDVAPTAGELNDVSYMLYLKGVRFLKESVPANLFELNISNPFIPTVGDRIHIQANIQEGVFDESLGEISEYIDIFTVNDDYRITRVGLNLKDVINGFQNVEWDAKEYLLSITASENDELGFYDPELEVYERMEEKAQLEMNI